MSGCFLVLVGLVVSGCSFHIDKNTEALSGDRSFNSVKEQIFRQRCLPCHGSSGGLDCMDYTSVRNHLDKIELRVFQRKDMPPNGSLPEAELSYLKSWMDAGAPEGPPGPPVAPQKPLKPVYASINDQLFKPLCIGCHSKTGTAFTIPLEPLSALLGSSLQLIVPGKPDESPLLFSVSRTDKKKMPPPKSGVRPLTKDEIAIVRQWIQEGAKP